MGVASSVTQRAVGVWRRSGIEGDKDMGYGLSIHLSLQILHFLFFLFKERVLRYLRKAFFCVCKIQMKPVFHFYTRT